MQDECKAERLRRSMTLRMTASLSTMGSSAVSARSTRTTALQSSARYARSGSMGSAWGLRLATR